MITVSVAEAVADLQCPLLLVACWQEEELRAKERLDAIKRANEILVSQTERMKALTSQKLLSDIQDVRCCFRVPREHRCSWSPPALRAGPCASNCNERS